MLSELLILEDLQFLISCWARLVLIHLISVILFVTKSDGIDRLKIKYYPNSNIQFILISNNGLLHRLYYENFSFRRLINNRNIQLIYNFSGSYQFFMKIPQIVKVQNLLFFSKKLDSVYIQREQFVLWVKQVLLKRIIFKFYVE